MSVEKKKNTSSGRNSMSDFIIRIFAEPDGHATGVVEHSQSGEFREFGCFLELVELINEKLEKLHFPQMANEMRSWTEELSADCKGGKSV